MRRFVYYLIATGLGAGYSPVAPGTAGSLLAVVGFYFLAPPLALHLLLVMLIFLLGVYVSHQVEKEKGDDPSLIVVDEIAGQAVSLLFLPPDWRLYLLAFLFFRLYDIVKPPPINRSQSIPHGWGVMVDDVLAGIYALLSVQFIRWLFF